MMKKIVSSLSIALVLLGAVLVLAQAGGSNTLATVAALDAVPDISYGMLGTSSFGSGNAVGDAGAPVQALVAADLDNDGNPDLVSANGKILGWVNDGTPFVDKWSSQTIGSPSVATYALVVGDLDNDGDLDIASGGGWSTGYEVQVWQNDGTPFDAMWAANDAGNADAVISLVVGDLDNDGFLDLVGGDDDALIQAWRNDYTPFSGLWPAQTVGTASTDVTALAIGDLDNDGDLDIVSGNAANRVSAWENDGTPFNSTWTPTTVFDAGDQIESLTLADVDGDGDLDILGGLGAGDSYELSSWQNDGSPFSGAWTRHYVGPKDAGHFYALAVLDFDVDGDLDLASSAQLHTTNAEVRTWENNGSPFAGTWSGADISQASSSVYALTAADLDRDGDPDLAAAANAIVVWPNTRTPGTWAEWTEGTQPTPADDALSVSLADFDHDGKLDIAAGTGGTGNGLHIWRGDGGYAWTQVLHAELPSSGVWPAVEWGQINKADELDLAAAVQGNGLRAWTVTQGGAVWDNISAGLPTTGDYQDLTLSHVNHGGLLDLVACAKSEGVRVWQGTGGAGSPDKWILRETLSDTMDFCAVTTGHVNHDGSLDLVAANCGNNRGILVWFGDSGFGFNPASSPATSGHYEAVALGDLDNDGDADLVAAPSGAGGVQVWLGSGGTLWSYQGVISPTLAVLSIDLGDYNRDGYLDIVAGLGADGVRVWRGDGGSSWTDVSTNLPIKNTYAGVAFARVDGDASLDVVGAESGGSGVRVWTAVEPPPGGWTDFQPFTYPPHTWAHTQQVTCTVQVADVGSGLAITSAEYRFSRDGGASWVGTGDGWLSATVSGPDGTTAPQVMTATNVLFNQDSDTQNAIQFRIADKAGLMGTSPVYYVAIDTTPPSNPSDLGSPSHSVGSWSSDNSVRFTWTDEGYDAYSGVWGYSWLFSLVADERPDEDADQGAGPGDRTLWAIPDGDWYLHFMTRDRAGNWADPVHLGPYQIDTSPPSTPTMTYSSHTIGGWSNDDTIGIGWEATDGGGIAGYSFVWHQHPSYYVDDTIDTAFDTNISDPLSPDGQWYFHVRAIDHGGSAGPTAHMGPFGIDTADPSGCWINVPRYSNSSTCLVEWHYLDTTSDIASYDVQVRDDTSGPGTWEDWLLGTVSTSAVYTGADLGFYSFRVRARDEAGNVSVYGCQDQTTVTDLNANDVEVTQGIQNLDNDVTLIAHKTTYVRFHVSSALTDIISVDARLHGTRGGSPLPGSPLHPTGGRITVHPAGDRSDLDDAFYFRLPAEWRSGTVELRAVIDPGDEIPEDEWWGNETVETVSFGTSGDFCIVFVPVHLHPSTYRVGDAGFWDMYELMKWMYPVRNAGIGTYSVGAMYPFWHASGWEYGIPADFDIILVDLEGVDFWTADPCGDTHYYGMVHPDSYPGTGATGMGERYNNFVGDNAAGVMEITRGSSWPQPVGGKTMAHELGHNFRRKHVWCTGCEEDGGDVDDGYPYEETIRHTCHSTETYTCRIGLDSSTGYYGFWPKPGDPPEVFPPLDTGDLMSYYYRRWPSDWTYHALLSELIDVGGSSVAGNQLTLSPAWAQAGEYLFATGIISPTGQTAELRTFYRTSDPDMDFVMRSFQQEVVTAQAEDVYSLVLEGGAGQVLYTHTFTVSALTDSNEAPGDSVFAEVCPYDDRTARIVLKQGSTELASRAVSAHAPTVVLLSPNGGETVSGQLTISWSGSDQDGDTLYYTIQYSPDDGATWRAVAVNWTGTSLSVSGEDLDVLPGSDQARIRVIASDGVNTAEDQSDAVFSLPHKAPQAYIIEPIDGSTFAISSTVVLRGTAIDAEDGPLDETGLISWSSSISGTLGTGSELWVSDLPTGMHRITMAVVDSDGGIGTDEIIIFVGMSPQRIYLPLILRQ